ncbi:hypothetical protein MUU47_09875 [Scandinavium sp. H11S7]|uniref:Uncharacterized protein n=1 Tax=Scandinavium hiltneri TaxID=2926519 RepID=A0ABT2E140_9ENTR|nr:hypothetical protein [Scandinavium hiltneri]MCS2161426.1 hypothetical protein [Scandinavium hiltneri]
MPVIKTSSSHSAPVAENIFWLRVENAARQYGFVLLVLLLLAGFCGLFSKGVFSNAHVASADGNVYVDYERFGRDQSDMDLKLTMKVPPGEDYTVTLGGQFMDAFEINALYPQPWRFSRQNGSITLAFHDQPEGTRRTLWLSIQPRSIGKVRSTLRVDHSPSVAITQFVYP